VSDERERHLRWMESMWKRHQSIAREERRKEEVLDIFREIAEVSKQWVGSPRGESSS
jgi:hypothetical protein